MKNSEYQVENELRTGEDILKSGKLTLAMEAHNGLSARIAMRSGFKALWASGLSIASQMGMRDCNEASWTQVVDVCEQIINSSNIPVFVDGDSGFGNYNNARKFSKAIEKMGAAGIALEDKEYPKMNSFIGENQALADPLIFCGKIKAIKDSSLSAGFSIIARTEALVSGLPIESALERAHLYADAGANAIFIHSKKSTAIEVFDFAKNWGRRTPLVVAPTTYYSTSVNELEDAGVALYLCANQNVRAAARAMQETCQEILSTRGLSTVDSKLISINELFELLDYDELELADAKYLQIEK